MKSTKVDKKHKGTLFISSNEEGKTQLLFPFDKPLEWEKYIHPSSWLISEDKVICNESRAYFLRPTGGRPILVKLHIDMKKRVTQKLNAKQFTDYMLYFLPKSTREALIGDLAEDYDEVRENYGQKRADIWYCTQIGTAISPLLWASCKKLFRRLVEWGVVGWVVHRFH